MAGSPDDIVYEKANELGATLITNDQGFADIRQYPPSLSNGIIILKILPDPKSVQAVHDVLDRLLINETYLYGNLYIVDRSKYRKRSNPWIYWKLYKFIIEFKKLTFIWRKNKSNNLDI